MGKPRITGSKEPLEKCLCYRHSTDWAHKNVEWVPVTENIIWRPICAAAVCFLFAFVYCAWNRCMSHQMPYFVSRKFLLFLIENDVERILIYVSRKWKPSSSMKKKMFTHFNTWNISTACVLLTTHSIDVCFPKSIFCKIINIEAKVFEIEILLEENHLKMNWNFTFYHVQCTQNVCDKQTYHRLMVFSL